MKQISKFFQWNYLCIYTADIIMKPVPQYVIFEVLTAVLMKSPIFWDMTTCSPLKTNQPASCWFLA